MFTMRFCGRVAAVVSLFAATAIACSEDTERTPGAGGDGGPGGSGAQGGEGASNGQTGGSGGTGALGGQGGSDGNPQTGGVGSGAAPATGGTPPGGDGGAAGATDAGSHAGDGGASGGTDSGSDTGVSAEGGVEPDATAEGGHGGAAGATDAGSDAEVSAEGGVEPDAGGGSQPIRLEAHGCTRAGASDSTGQATVELTWNNPHQACRVIAVGATVVWTGNFAAHPLAGGVAPNNDTSSAISTSDQSGASASVTFAQAGDYPYFCTLHSGTMRGVLYVE
jgi:plastocyanin